MYKQRKDNEYNDMHEKIIELEIRAEVPAQEREHLKMHLEKMGTFHSHTRRLSVMCFGNIGKKILDIRVRITNGECEVVVKSGPFGSHDRTEVAQKINVGDFLGMVKIFAQFGFDMKVGERENFNYVFPDDITASLVLAGPVSYIELEKMSSKIEAKRNIEKLRQYADQLGLQLLKSEEEFDELCNRLSEKTDWRFRDTKEDYAKLEKALNRYFPDKENE